MSATTLQRNWRRDSGTDEFGGARRKMLRLARPASPADGDGAGGRGSHRCELAWSLPKQSGGWGGVQVPGRAVSHLHVLSAVGGPGSRRRPWERGGDTRPERRGADGALSAQRWRSAARPPAPPGAPAAKGATAGAETRPPSVLRAGEARCEPRARRVQKSPRVSWSLCSF